MTKNAAQIKLWICEMGLSDSQNALQSLYQYYFERLLRFVALYITSESDAEEIISDTFLALWNGRKELVNVNHPEAYIFTMARNKAISFIRTQNNNKIRLDEYAIDLFFSTETTPEDDLISKERISQLNDAINTLPNKSKMVFKLVREDKMKYKEVAAILDLSIKTVEAHIAMATKKLRETLSKNK